MTPEKPAGVNGQRMPVRELADLILAARIAGDVETLEQLQSLLHTEYVRKKPDGRSTKKSGT